MIGNVLCLYPGLFSEYRISTFHLLSAGRAHGTWWYHANINVDKNSTMPRMRYTNSDFSIVEHCCSLPRAEKNIKTKNKRGLIRNEIFRITMYNIRSDNNVQFVNNLFYLKVRLNECFRWISHLQLNNSATYIAAWPLTTVPLNAVRFKESLRYTIVTKSSFLKGVQ